MFIAFITLFVLLISSSNAHTQGTIGVDVLTFDKILRRFHTVLVKFDDKFRMYSKRKNVIFYSIYCI